jgi:hypothetical protein
MDKKTLLGAVAVIEVPIKVRVAAAPAERRYPAATPTRRKAV